MEKKEQKEEVGRRWVGGWVGGWVGRTAVVHLAVGSHSLEKEGDLLDGFHLFGCVCVCVCGWVRKERV